MLEPKAADNLPASWFDIIYDGWKEYREKIKGWKITPLKIDIEGWEQYKQMIFNKLEAKKNGTISTR